MNTIIGYALIGKGKSKKMVWDSHLSQQSFPVLGSAVLPTPSSSSLSASKECTPRYVLDGSRGAILGNSKGKTPGSNASGKGYTNIIDLQESNKFLPISKYSPKMNIRLQSLPLLKQQHIYDNRQKMRDLFFKLRRLYRQQGAKLNDARSPAHSSSNNESNPFISTANENTNRNSASKNTHFPQFSFSHR